MLAQLLSSSWFWTIVCVNIVSYLYFRRQKAVFPVVAGDKNEFNMKAAKIIGDGLAKHQGPITVSTTDGFKIVLPASLYEWMRKNPDLDHQALIKEQYFESYSGFEAQKVAQNSDGLLVNIIRTKLGQNESTMPILDEHIRSALDDHWGKDSSWKTLAWEKDTTGVISRAAASIFVGPEDATDPEWQELTLSYVSEYFAAVGELHQWQTWLRPIVHRWWLPRSAKCRSLAARTRAKVAKILERREQEAKSIEDAGGSAPEHNDALAWTQAAVKSKNVDPGDVQLALAMVALFTTSETLRQTLIDIAQHQDLIEPLRAEIREAFSKYDRTLAALFHMELLDSVMKESQRLVPVPVALERKAVKDTRLPDGTIIPEGWHVMLSSSEFHNPDIYTDPEKFDGYRHLKRRQAGDTTSQFVQSSKNHFSFGSGKYQCPGRFFAANELKLCIAQMLLDYDIRIEPGYKPAAMTFGVFAMADPAVPFQVRYVNK